MRKTLVISAVNLTTGGALTVLHDAIDSAIKCLPDQWDVIALVHNFDTIKNKNKKVKVLEFPDSKKSWIKRLWFEWFVFNKISKQLNSDLWLSLHDITPRVKTHRQAVYCHNASPFHSLTMREAIYDPKFALFNLFYKYLYRVFIRRNHFVVVQQSWLRKEFQKIYLNDNIVVAYPSITPCPPSLATQLLSIRHPTIRNPFIMFYPCVPRVFKNCELLCEAMQLLPKDVRCLFELRLTIDGHENAYAKFLYRNFSWMDEIKFIGYQTKHNIDSLYTECDVVLFPSKLESWGLPISEAKAKGKPIILGNLPYAHESVGNYNAAKFLSPVDSMEWTKTFLNIAAGCESYDCHKFDLPNGFFAEDWNRLWSILIHDL